jgi:hypothetical protein
MTHPHSSYCLNLRERGDRCGDSGAAGPARAAKEASG